jgi:hypothetical protein
MDAFEQLVSEILWAKGFWIRTSVKVKLTADDKLQIGRPSAPRWEIDVVAYSGRDNLLHAIECKSYIDSGGVSAKFFRGAHPKGLFDLKGRFKLFNDDTLREVVFARLREQVVSSGACMSEPKVKLCLAAGHIASKRDRDCLRAHFAKNEWELWDEEWLTEGLKLIAAESYENQVSSVVAKLFIRNGWTAAPT